MGLNISDAESSFAYAKVEFDKWHTEFMKRWTMPLALTQLAMTMGHVPNEAKYVIPESIRKGKEAMDKLTGGRYAETIKQKQGLRLRR
jgi:hypothetical protein